ncbi:MAG: type II toxin-antitoxin system VapC family toxin [Firmicutes bacterium]|nr:type II toxin-antitoxin system VapC family toxin [Bacillota bacterium]
MLLDSNIIIYAADPRYPFLRELIQKECPVVSIANYIEVLGYDKLTKEQKLYFKEFFHYTRILPLDHIIAEKAITLRQQRRMSFGDAVVAATVIVNNLTLITRNIDDFKWISEIKLLNPFEHE